MTSRNSLLAHKAAMPLIALFCCLLWGSAFPALKTLYAAVGAERAVDRILQAGIRFTLAGCMVLAVSAYTQRKTASIRRALAIPRPALAVVVTIALLQTAVGYTCFYVGLGNTAAVKSSILVTFGNFATVVLAHFFIVGDRIDARKSAGLLLGIIGIIVTNITRLGSMDMSFQWLGEGALITGSLLMSIAAIIIKRKSHMMHPMVLNGWQMLMGGLLLLAGGLLGGGRIQQIHFRTILLIIYLAAVSATAFTLWFMMFKYHSPAKLAIYKFSIPIFGSLLSVLLIPAESMTIEMLGALVLVSLGIVAVNLRRKLPSNTP